ncbi:MAG: polyprenyl synthetase family protein [Candidatus Woesearchaeota archaeon]
MVLENLASIRDELFERIDSYFDDVADHVELPWWTSELTVEFRRFAMTGKALRGSLVVLSHDLFAGEHRAAAIDAGVAIELFHSAILIHDDIMDRGEMRRGREATHLRLAKGRDAHTGESLAINVGSCGFFLSYDVLSRLDVDHDTHKALLSYYSRNLTKLGLAQMQDVALASSDELPSEDDIERVLIEKSGRYTFSVPLALGAIVAGAQDRVRFLELFGEHLGFVFQVKDDEIGLFGDPKVTGKPVGSDVREGKKTLYWHALATSADPRASEVLSMYGVPDASDEQVAQVIAYIDSSGIRSHVTERMVSRAMALRERVSEEGFDEQTAAALGKLIEWNLSRTK